LLPERDCSRCTRQVEWGCYAEPERDLDTNEVVRDEDGEVVWRDPAVTPVEVDDELQWQCPRRPVLDDPSYWRDLLFYYGEYRNGRLPDDGPVTAQSNRGLRLMQSAEAARAGCDQRERELDAARRSRGKRRG